MNPAKPTAVVIGGGIAGIAAAAALRGSCSQVTIVERDDLEAPADRPGVPQVDQLHNLLSCAQRAFESLLPGFGAALREAGAGVARVAADTEVFELGERMPLRDLGLRLVCADRLTIERVARRLLLEQGGVRILDRSRALGLSLAPAGGVVGVAVEREGGRRLLDAPLVVDASGPRALGFRWLRKAGLEAPGVDVRQVNRWYASAPFERAAGERGRDRFWLALPSPPSTRTGMVCPRDPGHWQVSLSGSFGEEAPRTIAAMRAYAATLGVPWIAEMIAAARPAGQPHVFRRRLASWRRYDLLSRPLPGLLPIGDAVACLNPLFGQGMSVLSQQALELAEMLRCGAPDPCSAGFTAEYLTRSATICEAAWRLGELVADPDPRSRAAFLGLEEPLDGPALCRDPELHRRYVEAWHLVEPIGSPREPAAPVLELAG